MIYAACGYNPSPTVYDHHASVSRGGAVLDLTAGCSSYWRVTAVNYNSTDVVMNVRIGASTSSSRVYDLVVGMEAPATAQQIAYVRRAMRHAAWRFYGATGGTHIIRSWTYLTPPNCGGAHVCYRNVTGCAFEGAAVMHPTGGTPSLAVDICRNISVGFSGTSPEPVADSAILTHEFGHLLAGNGTLNQLADEYWTSNPYAFTGARGRSTVDRVMMDTRGGSTRRSERDRLHA